MRSQRSGSAPALDSPAHAGTVASKADVVYVALGSPKQEKLIAALRHRLPQAWWIGVGISFSFLCGKVRRAPRWLQRVGLEWLHRLAQEPSRLAGRYLRHGLPFALSLFGYVLWNRLRRISHLHGKQTA